MRIRGWKRVIRHIDYDCSLYVTCSYGVCMCVCVASNSNCVKQKKMEQTVKEDEEEEEERIKKRTQKCFQLDYIYFVTFNARCSIQFKHNNIIQCFSRKILLSFSLFCNSCMSHISSASFIQYVCVCVCSFYENLFAFQLIRENL